MGQMGTGWTQLGELRDAYDKFLAAGIKLYAISYDDQEILAEYAEKESIPYPLLSDLNSDVIRRYGIFNTHRSGTASIIDGHARG